MASLGVVGAWIAANAGTITAVASVAAAGVSAYGASKAASDRAAAFDYNAKLKEKEGRQAEFESRTRLRRLMSTQRALYAKAGVDLSSGSPLLMLAETAAEGEREAISIIEGGQSSAKLLRLSGQQSRTAGAVGAGSTLLTGIGTSRTNFFRKK